jgi:type IV pilus modification protein PilV
LNSDIRADAANRGFTLLEVLVALILLAVGLLGLQALGISAAQATARAEQNSRAAAIATEQMETVLRQIRANQQPTQRCETFSTGYRISVRIDTDSPHSANGPFVTVEVTPRGSTAPYMLESYAFSLSAVAPTGSAC